MLSYKHTQTNNTMKVFVTSDHDTSLVSSPTEIMPTDEQLREMQRLIDLSESTDLDESELDSDSWVDDMMMGVLEGIQY